MQIKCKCEYDAKQKTNASRTEMGYKIFCKQDFNFLSKKMSKNYGTVATKKSTKSQQINQKQPKWKTSFLIRLFFLTKNKGKTKNYYEKISSIFQRVYVGV